MGLAPQAAAQTEALTLLLLGEGALRDELSDALEAAGHDVEFGELEHARATVTAAAPDLVVLFATTALDAVDSVIEELAGDRNGSLAPLVVIGSSALSNVTPNLRHGAVATLSEKLPLAKLTQRLIDLGNGVPDRSGLSQGPMPRGQVQGLLEGLAAQKRSGKLTVTDGAGRSSRSVMLKAGTPITESGRFIAEAEALVAAESGRFVFEERTTARIDSVLPPAPPVATASPVAPPPAAPRAAAVPTPPRAAPTPVASSATPPGPAPTRVLVVDSQRQRRDALCAALATRGMQTRALGPHANDVEPQAAFDPQVVVVNEDELGGACAASVSAVEAHPRLRWASLLVSPPHGANGSGVAAAALDALVGRIDALVQPDRDLSAAVASRSEVATRLELIGPVRTLRAIAAAQTPSRVLIRHPRVSVELAFDAAGGVSARARARERGNAPLDGAPAVATLFAIQAGRVQVRRATSAPSDVEPIEALIALAVADRAPIRSSILPPEPAPEVAVPPRGASPAGLPPPPPATLRLSDLLDSTPSQPSPLVPAELGSRTATQTPTPPAPAPRLASHVLVSDAADPAAPTEAAFVPIEVTLDASDVSSEAPRRLEPTPSSADGLGGRFRRVVHARGRIALAAAALLGLGALALRWSASNRVADEEPAASAKAVASSSAVPASSATLPAAAAPNSALPAAPPEEPSDVEAPAEGVAAGVEPNTLDTGDDAEADDDADSEAEAASPALGRHAAEIAAARRHTTDAAHYRRQGRLGLAEAAYLRALAAYPRYARAMSGVVRVHIQRKDGREAVRWAEQLVAMQPNRSNNQLLLGDAYALRGQRNKAVAAWKQSLKYGNLTAKKRLQTAR